MVVLTNTPVSGPNVIGLLLLESFAFFAYFWIFRGQTLGMQAWRLRIDNLEGWHEAASGVTLCHYYTDNFASPWVSAPYAKAIAGDLRYIEDRHQTPAGRDVRLRVYVEPENIDRCDHAMHSLIQAMRCSGLTYSKIR